MREIVERVFKLMESNLKPEILNEANNEIRHQYLSAEKARTHVELETAFNLDQGAGFDH